MLSNELGLYMKSDEDEDEEGGGNSIHSRQDRLIEEICLRDACRFNHVVHLT